MPARMRGGGAALLVWAARSRLPLPPATAVFLPTFGQKVAGTWPKGSAVGDRVLGLRLGKNSDPRVRAGEAGFGSRGGGLSLEEWRVVAGSGSQGGGGWWESLQLQPKAS